MKYILFDILYNIFLYIKNLFTRKGLLWNKYEISFLFVDDEFQQFIVKNVVETKLSIKRVEDILNNILNRQELSQKEDNSSASDILDDFPIKDCKMLQRVEYRLKTDESYKNLVV